MLQPFKISPEVIQYPLVAAPSGIQNSLAHDQRILATLWKIISFQKADNTL
jgi:hypothetical protein